jgi:hypothetical protein
MQARTQKKTLHTSNEEKDRKSTIFKTPQFMHFQVAAHIFPEESTEGSATKMWVSCFSDTYLSYSHNPIPLLSPP